MQVFAKNLSGKTLTLSNVLPSDSVESLKLKIYEKDGTFPPDASRA